MSGFLDTSMTVRYLTKDPLTQAVQAAKIIQEDENLIITEGTIAETAHVLLSLYSVPRTVVLDRLIDLLQRENIQV